MAGKGTLNATGGDARPGYSGGAAGMSQVSEYNSTYTGGGGGAGGSAADGIGSGGTGGGGGGGGASANIDGESALFGAADLDDLWGYGGSQERRLFPASPSRSKQPKITRRQNMSQGPSGSRSSKYFRGRAEINDEVCYVEYNTDTC